MERIVNIASQFLHVEFHMNNEPVLDTILLDSHAAGWCSVAIALQEYLMETGAAIPLADSGDFSRALKNLAESVPDTKPEGGTLSIRTANVNLQGAGAVDRIFEPFFTTKESGQGTAVGLATVLGIVERSGGAVRCESNPDLGTAFTIFLPTVSAAAPITAPSAAGGMNMAPRGSEVILLVEDEDMARQLARTILETSGYVILEACNGREGLTICETNQGHIDLLLSDVVMPELSGSELAEQAVKLRPAMKIMFMSGYTPDLILK